MKNQEPILQKVILYGVIQPQQLTLALISKNNIKVGILDRVAPTLSTEQSIDYEMWAYPDGIKIYGSDLSIINDPNPQFSFGSRNQLNHDVQAPPDYLYSFVFTDYDLNRTYCTALAWHEKVLISEDTDLQVRVSQRLPKFPIEDVISNPCLTTAGVILIYIPKVIIVTSKANCFNFQKHILSYYYNHVLRISAPNYHIPQLQLSLFRGMISKHGFQKAQQLYETINAGRQTQKYQKPVSKQAKNKAKSEKKYVVSIAGLKRFYTSLLFYPYKDELKTVELFQHGKRVCKIGRRQGICFGEPSVDLLKVVSYLGVDKLIILWKEVLLERQILIFSSDQYLTIELCESLLYLLQPLQWENIYIPFLPFHLCHHIQAMGGYLIGMSRIHMDYMIENFNLSGKTIIDLDHCIIIQQQQNNLIVLPPNITAYLQECLTKIARSLSPLYFQPSIQTVLSVKKSFFLGLLFLLNNYRLFLESRDKEMHFNKKGYEKFLGTLQGGEIFAHEIVKTMIFSRLCERHLEIEASLNWNQNDIESLFVYCHELLCKKAGDDFWSLNELLKGGSYCEYIDYKIKQSRQALQSEAQRVDIESLLIKYVAFMEVSSPENILKTKYQPQRPKSIWENFLALFQLQKNIQTHPDDLKGFSLTNYQHFDLRNLAQGKPYLQPDNQQPKRRRSAGL